MTTWPTGSLAPQLRPVRPDTSRYVHLPVLYLCTHCREPRRPLESYAFHDGLRERHTGLCRRCADRLFDAWRERRATEHLRATPVTCPACAADEHGLCVRPCTCAGDRHGRVVAHTPGIA